MTIKIKYKSKKTRANTKENKQCDSQNPTQKIKITVKHKENKRNVTVKIKHNK